MEMLDRVIYNICGKIDDAVAWVENYAIKISEWCWKTRVKTLRKRRKINDSKRRTNSNK